MTTRLAVGDCVQLPDGRIGRIRARIATRWRVRVRRASGSSNQFLEFAPRQLRRVVAPKGWMSPEGYRRYLKATLAKMRERTR